VDTLRRYDVYVPMAPIATRKISWNEAVELISAAPALAERVLSGGDREQEDYFSFLKSGRSRFPIESLRVTGVDMSSPAPVEASAPWWMNRRNLSDEGFILPAVYQIHRHDPAGMMTRLFR
jgi:oligoendopeptidase F